MKKGFTLVELLAIIVVISIVAIISVSLTTGIISKTKKGALKASAYGLIETANIYYTGNLKSAKSTTEFICNISGCKSGDSELSYKGEIDSGRVKIYSDGKVALCIENEENSAVKLATESEVTVLEGTCDYSSDTYAIDEYVSLDKYNELKQQFEDYKNAQIDTSDATATESDILEGKTAYVNKIKLTGTNKGYDAGYLSGYNIGFLAGKAAFISKTVGWSCSYYDNQASSCTSTINIGTGKTVVYVGSNAMTVSVDTSGANGSGSISYSYNSTTGNVTVTYSSGGRWTYHLCSSSGKIVYY